MTEHIIAVFETEANASSAVRSLKIAGISPGPIRQYSGSLSDRAGVITEAHEPESGGFWAWLFGEEPVSDPTRSAYASDMDMYDRRIHAGNCIVSVMVDESMIHEAIEIINQHSPIDIDEHTDEHGYADHPGAYGSTTGLSTETLPATASVSASGIGEITPEGYATAGMTPVPATSSLSGTDTRTSAAATREEVIPLAEEQLDISKRTIDRGTTTVRRYVVEKPVEQDVTLRDERVTVEKRRPLGAGEAPGPGSFEERVVEVRETGEEPVVAKTAQVVEEVVIGREATERTETVRDTVRKEEVEVTGNGRGNPNKATI